MGKIFKKIGSIVQISPVEGASCKFKGPCTECMRRAFNGPLPYGTAGRRVFNNDIARVSCLLVIGNVYLLNRGRMCILEENRCIKK